MSVPDFLKDKEENGIEEIELNTLEGMIESYDTYAADVERADKYLKECNKNFNRLAMEIIPDFLLSNGITQMKLKDGRHVKIKEDISTTVKDELAFRKFLKARGDEAIIKVKYNFSRMANKANEDLTDFLIDNNYDFEIDESIHAQTKKKYFKELIKEIGKEELPEWVSIYEIRKATVK